MKILCVFLFAARLLTAQAFVGSFRIIVPFTAGTTDVVRSPSVDSGYYTSEATGYNFQILADAFGDKYFIFNAKACTYPPPEYINGGIDLLNYPPAELEDTDCEPLGSSAAITIGPVAAALRTFYSLNVQPPAQRVIVYNGVTVSQSSDPSAAAKPRLTTQPAASQPVHPQIVMLDGFTENLVAFDLITYAMTGQVEVPTTLGPLAIRHAATGPENEVWTVNGGLEVTVSDLGSQQVLANILTPSIPITATPAGIAFTNDGAIALEAVLFSSPDSAGNNGALVVFDAVKRTVTSTLLLKDGPVAFVMAPDSLMAYLLGRSGQITYYDVLSATADFATSTFSPGMNDGYPGSEVFIHPDGTRLFWHVGPNVEVFDLATHKVVRQIVSGLPGTSGIGMRLSVDGSQLFLGNGQGNNSVIDTRYGTILGTSTISGSALTFGGIPMK